MDNSKILMKEKLGFSNLLQETFKIFHHNPNFIFLSFLTSLPFFSFMLIHELWLQKTLLQATTFISNRSDSDDKDFIIVYDYFHPEDKLLQFLREFGITFLQLGLTYFPLIHLPHLITTIGIVAASSRIYSGQKIINIRETLSSSFENGTFNRTLITSIYVLLMTFLVFLGLLAITSQASVFSVIGSNSSSLFYGLLFIVLLYKYLEWSSVWKLGIVASVLEEKRGDVALGVSAYISRGNRRNGGILNGVFFLWEMSLRAMSVIYLHFHQGDLRRAVIVAAFQVLLVCVGNAIVWVIFMVFFYDCKLRFLEKKVDVEEGRRKGEGKKRAEAVEG